MKKYNINKLKNLLKYKIIPFGIIGITVVSGCSNKGYSKKYVNESSSTNTTSVGTTQPNKIEIESIRPLLDKGDDYYDNYVNVDFNDYYSYKDYLNSIDINFIYSDLFSIEESLEKYNRLSFTDKHNSKLNDLNESDLLRIVKENNKEYKKNKSSSYKELSDNELVSICKIIVSVCNDYIKEHSEISKSRLLCVLSDLKIFNKSSFNNAFVTNDNCLIMSPNMIDLTKININEDISYKVLVHEIIHLLQKGCNCEKNKNSLINNYGFCYSFEYSEMNSLDFSWFYESAAEKNMSNYIGCDPITYKSMIGYLDSMSLINLLKQSYKVGDTEALSFSRTLDKLYNYFDATTDEEKKDILKLMYSIEVLQRDPEDFYKKYKQVYGEDKSQKIIDKVRYQVKSSICSKFSQIFYKNLANFIVENKLTLDDIFYIITIYECDLSNHLDYDNVNKYQYNEYFFEKYEDIQSNFFYLIAKSMGISQESIEEMYSGYTAYNKKNERKTNLDFLSSEKKQFIDYIENKYKFKSTYTISSTYNNLKNNEIQKKKN